ncbi:M23 family metallopeptidase [Hydrogenobacter sp. T-2]|uniref:M23 family metallopeptidase n=1 Tax=Pampinifervens diazotrophicum TaxID=1632018 RepID=UPI002B25B408|nr:M23 family metallopeptidase [Hydrogenobacter sp. T-2]WPM31926.1 M23 family metallopeptidase [Hydrogenobacter sp. T-2]
MRYRYRLEERREKRLGFVRLIRRLAIFSFVLIMFYTLFIFLSGRPSISEEDLRSLSLIPSEKTFTLRANKPIEEIRIYAEQEGQKREIFKAKPTEPSKEITFTLRAKEAGLKDGNARLFVELSSGFLQSRTYILDALVDTIPPRFSVISYLSSPTLGGTSAVKIRTEEEVEAFVLMGQYEYMLYSLGDGYYFGLFPVRLDQQNLSSITVAVKDKAGNLSQQTLSLRIRNVRFKEDNITIDDSFINRVIYPLLGEEGKGLEPLQAFKRINELWRQRDMARLEEIGRKSEPRVLWEGAFLQLPRSKVFAGYGEIRHYYYDGQKVSESRHMGFDFASVERAEVPASNSGVVVFAGDLGIYGNTVVIDHGMGLMSLYGHLSEIRVKEGQYVKKGEVIGRTGKTGLALGDHLHFGILVQGYEVNPLQWLDPKWIRDNILFVLDAK